MLIYSALGLHEEAVNLALEVDIALAKEHGLFFLDFKFQILFEI